MDLQSIWKSIQLLVEKRFPIGKFMTPKFQRQHSSGNSNMLPKRHNSARTKNFARSISFCENANELGDHIIQLFVIKIKISLFILCLISFLQSTKSLCNIGSCARNPLITEYNQLNNTTWYPCWHKLFGSWNAAHYYLSLTCIIITGITVAVMRKTYSAFHHSLHRLDMTARVRNVCGFQKE